MKRFFLLETSRRILGTRGKGHRKPWAFLRRSHRKMSFMDYCNVGKTRHLLMSPRMVFLTLTMERQETERISLNNKLMRSFNRPRALKYFSSVLRRKCHFAIDELSSLCTKQNKHETRERERSLNCFINSPTKRVSASKESTRNKNNAKKLFRIRLGKMT